MLGLVWGYTDIYTVPLYVYDGWGKYRLEPTLEFEDQTFIPLFFSAIHVMPVNITDHQ